METVLFDKINTKIKNYFSNLGQLPTPEADKANHFITNGAKAAEALDPLLYKEIIAPIEASISKFQKEIQSINFKFWISQTQNKMNLVIKGEVKEFPLASLSQICSLLQITDSTPYYYVLVSYILYPENYNLLQLVHILKEKSLP